MAKKYIKLILILIIPALLTGCWDYNDINRRSITLSVGVDEINGNVEITGRIANLTSKSSATEGEAQLSDTYFFQSTGYNFEKARFDFDTHVPSEDFSGALRVITFSKKYAQKGIESYINRIDFLPGMRKSLLITACMEPTRDLFLKPVKNDISVGYAIENTIRTLEREGMSIYTTLQDIQSSIQFKDIGYVIPYITKENDSIKYLGLAAMKDSKLVGIIDSRDSIGYLLILGEKTKHENVISHPRNIENPLSLKSILKKRKITTSYVDNKVNIDMKLNINTQLIYPYYMESINSDDIKTLEEELSNNIKKAVLSAIERSQTEFQCDIFGFGKYFKADNYNIYKNINWQEEYLKANFNVDVELKIVNFNLFETEPTKNN
ncbi:Ger(x)C family spore germination protein [Clostridium malenominatum]|uniref:Ger(X)C family spore germination protein n=1 Tax=Clostridium malenominatum TaxID=1539 RepID=A0ABN1IML8_9CLOT